MSNPIQMDILDLDIRDASLMPIEEEWHPPSTLPDLTNCDRIAIDLETRDPNLTTLGPGWARNDGYIIGVAVAAGDFVGYYAIRHEGGGNWPENKIFKWLQKQLDTPHIEKVMHNAMYDLGWLRWAAWGYNPLGCVGTS